MMTSSKKSQSGSVAAAILPWVVWSLACVFYFYESLLQVSLGVMGSELMSDFAITSQTLGFLSGIFYYSYSPMQLPCGILMDRFGPNRILTLATIICALSTLIFGMTNSLGAAFLARLMIGFGAAFAAVGTMKLAANWFSPTRFALLTGLMVTIGMLGAIGAEAPLALMIDSYGWRHTMVIMGGVGLLLAVLIFMVAQDHPPSVRAKPTASELTKKRSMLTSVAVLFKNKQLWLVATYGGLMYMATPVFCGLWGVPFLINSLHVSKPVAANSIALVFLGWAIASPLWGIYSNRIGRRKPPMYIGAIGAFITCVLFIYAPIHAIWLMRSLLFAFGIFSAGFLCAFSVAKELCNNHYVATGLGLMNMLNMVGIAIAQPLIGFILDKLWVGDVLNGVRCYPLGAYRISLAVLPIGIGVACLLLPKIQETYCQDLKSS